MLILLEVEECISSDTFYKFMMFLHKIRGCHERDRMVVGFTTTCAISAYYHLGCVYEPHSGRGVLDTTLRDKVCQLILASGLSFYPGSPVSSTNKTDHHNIAEILLKVALNTINPNETLDCQHIKNSNR
jgi:hypothetical protein